MPIWAQWVSFTIAIIGAISGLYALWLNYKRTKIQINREKERLENKKKAIFKISRTKQQGSKSMQDRFLLANIGEAAAYNVSIEFHSWNRMKTEKRKVNPILFNEIPENINAGQELNLLMIISKDTSPPFEVKIYWDDDNKQGNEKTEILN